MAEKTYFQVVDEYEEFHSYQTMEEAIKFAKQVLMTTGADYLEIFEVKAAACVSRGVNFNFQIYE